MNKKPRCIIITSRPGSGKTTLAGELCKKMYLPKISRDEIKRGLANPKREFYHGDKRVCNQNGSYTDTVDVEVIVDPFSDNAIECQGDTYDVTCYVGSPEDDNGTTSAEEINVGGGTYTYEWYGSTAGTVDWSSCLGNITIQFAAIAYNNHSIEDDITIARDYNAPTAVRMRQLTATSGGGWGISMLAAIAVVLCGSVWLLRRRRFCLTL